jgi:hypothetical protein
MRTSLFALMLCAGVVLLAGIAAADPLNDLDTVFEPGPRSMRAPSAQTDVDNGDGTWTWTQQVDEYSTAPHYTLSPSGGGFEIYSWWDEDYGWMHDFSHWNDANLTILSATMTIVGWDIDSNVEDGEFDGVHIDGVLLDPGFLQGTNDTWSVTVFDLRVSDIVDDGILNVWLDIDMTHDYDWWATALDYSRIEIVYSTTTVNQAPFQPELSYVPVCPGEGEDLVVTVVGPTPADPDGDAVTYVYRWFVDITDDGVPGPFIDDEFAGRGDHTGNVVPAADTAVNDLWRVQVTPVDEHGTIGEYETVTWGNLVGCYPIATENLNLGTVKAIYR